MRIFDVVMSTSFGVTVRAPQRRSPPGRARGISWKYAIRRRAASIQWGRVTSGD